MAKVSSAYFLMASSFMSGNRPYVSRFPTDATGTPFTPRARGRPRPKFMPVSTFSAPGSISRITLPSQPSWPTSSGRAVCQMSIERKCDRFGLGYPIPWITATLPSSQSSLMGSMPGLKPSSSSILSTSFSGMPTAGLKSR